MSLIGVSAYLGRADSYGNATGRIVPIGPLTAQVGGDRCASGDGAGSNQPKLLERRLADDHIGAVFFVDPFQSRGEVHRVA